MPRISSRPIAARLLAGFGVASASAKNQRETNGGIIDAEIFAMLHRVALSSLWLLPQAAQKFGRPEEGRRNREIAGARIFAGVKRTADEGRRVEKAVEIPWVDFAGDRLRLARIIREKIEKNEPLIMMRVVQADEILKKIERCEPVEYKNVIVEGDLDLRDLGLKKDRDNKLVVNSLIKIQNSEIKGNVISVKLLFRELIDLTGTIFKGKIWFMDAVFKEGISCSGCTFFEDTYFKGSLINCAIFQNAKFKNNSYFDGTKFTEYINFTRSKFKKFADFRYTEFGSGASFGRSKFYKNVRFEEAHFRGSAGFDKAEFGIDLDKIEYLPSKRFKGDSGVRKKERPNFIIDFKKARFYRQADFESAKFYTYTNFSKTQMDGEAIYIRAWFYNEVDFQGARFYESVYFNDARFLRYVSFLGSQFRGEVAYFIDTRFRGDVYFGAAQFLRFAYFQHVLFDGNVYFKSANFNLDADFQDVQFNKNLDLNGAKINRLLLLNVQYGNDSQILLKFARCRILDIDWNDAEKHVVYKYDGVYDWGIYSELIKNFRDLARFDDADDCYYEFRKKHQDTKNWFIENTSRIGRFNWSKLCDSIGLWSCGYGTKLSRSFILVAISAAITLILYNKYGSDNLWTIFFGFILSGIALPLFIVVLARKLIR